MMFRDADANVHVDSNVFTNNKQFCADRAGTEAEVLRGSECDAA